MEVIKSNGDKVPFDIDKIKASVQKTGASAAMADRVAKDVLDRVKNGMSTAEVQKIVLESLRKESNCFACRYNLRAAILRFGPAGFNFEQYVASILRAYNYDAHVPEGEFEGACVRHELDVIAQKDGRSMMIEAKFRNHYKDDVNLKDTMATWARFLDLVDAAAVGRAPHFDEVWIITNAKFSDRAQQFGVCKGMHMIGWDTPEERSFAGMVDFRMLYPITVLDSVSDKELNEFAKHEILLCREVTEHEPEELQEKIGVSLERAKTLISECAEIIEGEEKAHTHNKK